jgi:hypothetical protein
MGKEINGVSVIFDVTVGNYAKSTKLMTQSALSNHELGCIGPVKTVDAIRSCDASLQQELEVVAVSIAEETSVGHDFFRDGLQGLNDVLVPAASGINRKLTKIRL